MVEGNAVGGADVTFTVTATDSEDGDLTSQVACTPSSGSFLPLGGPHVVTCSVTDA